MHLLVIHFDEETYFAINQYDIVMYTILLLFYIYISATIIILTITIPLKDSINRFFMNILDIWINRRRNKNFIGL